MSRDQETEADRLEYVLARIADRLDVAVQHLGTIAGALAPPPPDLAALEAARATLIEDLELSVRAENCLRNANIQTAGELARCTKRDLRRVKNIGTITIREYEAALEKLGLSLASKFQERHHENQR